MTTQTHTPAEPIDPAWLAELTAELAAYGYKVTKARATRTTSTESAPGRQDGATPTKAPRSGKASHDACSAHYRVPGMVRPVCVTREGATIEGTDELVSAEWTDTERVLAFAVDMGARMTEHRTRGTVDCKAADQSRTPMVGWPSTYDAEKARKVTEQARMRKTPHAFDGSSFYGQCDACAVYKAEHHRIEQAA